MQRKQAMGVLTGLYSGLLVIVLGAGGLTLFALRIAGKAKPATTADEVKSPQVNAGSPTACRQDISEIAGIVGNIQSEIELIKAMLWVALAGIFLLILKAQF